jgi:tetratricopeptide (TPR) repeat protein
LDFDLETIRVPFAAEALARAASDEGDWAEALAQAESWLDDQPFDTNAALVGSYVASIGLEDWEVSADIARVGLRARPGDVMLTNNLAYALIEAGQLREASMALSQLDLSSLSDTDRIVVTATLGLLRFRSGDLEAGRQLYSRSIDLARRNGDRGLEVRAHAMLLREVRASADDEEIDRLATMIRMLVKDTKDPGILVCVRRAAVDVPLGESRRGTTSGR